MASAPKREKRETKLPEIGGESTAKPVFQIKPPPQKKTMNTDIRKQTMEMQREIDAVAVRRQRRQRR